MTPRILDLFCGAGGCSVGYHQAGLIPYGVDNEPHPDYPYPIHVGDALAVLRSLLAGERVDFTHPDGTVEWLGGDDFAVIHASPPCKSETDLQHLSAKEHPNLLGPTLDILRSQLLPWVVENVEGTKQMPGALLLCGAAFGLGATCRDGVRRHLRRHRLFESSVPLMGAGCACPAGQPVGVYGTGGGGGR